MNITSHKLYMMALTLVMNHIYIALFSAIMALTFLSVQVSAQPLNAQRLLEQFVENIERFNSYFPQEKVYLHFDNTGYFRGETMWFKAYVLRDDNGAPTNLSSVLYVELVSPGGEVIKSNKIHLEGGTGDGSFSLDSLLMSGFYEVRAYTRYMMNWDSDCCFSRVIPIFNKPRHNGDYSNPIINQFGYRKRLPNYRKDMSQDSIVSELADKGITVRYYPEGGHMIAGVRQKVAFEVIDKDGMPQDVTGYLMEDGKPLCSVRTIHNGRGVLDYTPKAATHQNLLLSDTSGRQHLFSLPEIEVHGVALTIGRNSLKGLRVGITATGIYNKVPKALLMTHRGSVKHFQLLSAADSLHEVVFTREMLPNGIGRLSVITANGDILADRKFFVYPETGPDSIQIVADADYLLPYTKTTLNVQSRGKTTFSVAVRDADTDVNGINGNCWTWLLLTSDLKGYVHQPDYYLECDDSVHYVATDLLMMTQGWVRYNLPQMMGKSPFVKSHPIEDGLYVYGQLKQAKRKYDVGGVDMRLTLYNSSGAVLQGKFRTDHEGNYAFRVPDCEDEWRMLIDTKKHGRNAKYWVSVDRQFSPVCRMLDFMETQRLPVDEPNVRLRPATSEELLLNMPSTDKRLPMTKRLHPLKEVVVRKTSRVFDRYAVWESEKWGSYHASLYYDVDREADRIYDSGQDTPDFFSWLYGRNPFFKGLDLAESVTSTEMLSIDRQSGKPVIIDTFLDGNVATSHKFMDRKGLVGDDNTYKGRPVFWVLNNKFYALTGLTGGQMMDLENDFEAHNISIEELPVWMEDVRSVYISEDVQAWTNYAVSGALHGIRPVTVHIYKHRKFPVYHKGVRLTWFRGYDKPKTFEMPDYSVMPPEEDFRRTLYWNPNLTTDENGKAMIVFYNNATCKQLRVSAEGISPEGNAIICR